MFKGEHLSFLVNINKVLHLFIFVHYYKVYHFTKNSKGPPLTSF